MVPVLVFVLSLCISVHGNMEGDYCKVFEEYGMFKESLDNFLASGKEYCKNKQFHRECASIKEEFPDATDGVYRIKPRDGKPSFLTYCDMTEQGGGWLVIQRRQDGSEDFYKTWFEYRDGFGNLTGEFWLGDNISSTSRHIKTQPSSNEKIHRLTNQATYELRVDFQDATGTKAYAEYNHFRVGNMTEFYKLTISGYSGNAGDRLAYHNNYRFSAWNLDLDTYSGNCAQQFHGAWWYNDCHYSNLNGLYTGSGGTGVYWHGLSNSKKTTMKIRPVQ